MVPLLSYKIHEQKVTENRVSYVLYQNPFDRAFEQLYSTEHRWILNEPEP